MRGAAPHVQEGILGGCRINWMNLARPPDDSDPAAYSARRFGGREAVRAAVGTGRPPRPTSRIPFRPAVESLAPMDKSVLAEGRIAADEGNTLFGRGSIRKLRGVAEVFFRKNVADHLPRAVATAVRPPGWGPRSEVVRRSKRRRETVRRLFFRVRPPATTSPDPRRPAFEREKKRGRGGFSDKIPVAETASGHPDHPFDPVRKASDISDNPTIGRIGRIRRIGRLVIGRGSAESRRSRRSRRSRSRERSCRLSRWLRRSRGRFGRGRYRPTGRRPRPGRRRRRSRGGFRRTGRPSR